MYICTICEKEFSTKSNLNRHSSTNKKCKQENKITYDCNYCNKKISSNQMLQYHINICKKKEDNKEQTTKHDKIIKELIDKVQKIENDIGNKKYKKKTIPKTLKMTVWYTHIGKEIGMIKCPCCNSNEISQMDFDCGHVIAESKGGSTTVENLKPICNKCNRSMRTMNMNEFKQKYFK